MKSSNRLIHVWVNRAKGQVPPFIELAQRNFEKDPPLLAPGSSSLTTTIPIDTLRLVLGDDSPLLEDLEEIEVCYSKKEK